MYICIIVFSLVELHRRGWAEALSRRSRIVARTFPGELQFGRVDRGSRTSSTFCGDLDCRFENFERVYKNTKEFQKFKEFHTSKALSSKNLVKVKVPESGLEKDLWYSSRRIRHTGPNARYHRHIPTRGLRHHRSPRLQRTNRDPLTNTSIIIDQPRILNAG